MAAASSTNGWRDFTEEDQHCSAKLVVDGRTLYVNGHALAEHSPVFAKLFFDENYTEHREKVARIKDETLSDMVEFLRCLCDLKPVDGIFCIFK